MSRCPTAVQSTQRHTHDISLSDRPELLQTRGGWTLFFFWILFIFFCVLSSGASTSQSAQNSSLSLAFSLLFVFTISRRTRRGQISISAMPSRSSPWLGALRCWTTTTTSIKRNFVTESLKLLPWTLVNIFHSLDGMHQSLPRRLTEYLV